ncbi:UBP-type zinc finger domain-containing protein [Natronosporangium hydrolyticum]|uniref:UBP-type zinc finger domain-containing protein n=1 Tax=Natronosporangium hydrolyticum TaxID=2811111 RepID=A0A895YEZ5_9ACTN|nr:UBP-type zinc finger domain-containing protein [Natronosporangium hydrolyticum]QSB14712.1 UBP-type zinc finger domain-containing protein [Natronosporangium hydrolyticum]
MTGWVAAQPAGPGCAHAQSAPVIIEPAQVCAECVEQGTEWVHLRRCLSCQHIGCCDSSPQRHASRHWRRSDHPVASSAEPREGWAWCFPDELLLVPAG